MQAALQEAQGRESALQTAASKSGWHAEGCAANAMSQEADLDEACAALLARPICKCMLCVAKLALGASESGRCNAFSIPGMG